MGGKGRKGIGEGRGGRGKEGEGNGREGEGREKESKNTLPSISAYAPEFE